MSKQKGCRGQLTLSDIQSHTENTNLFGANKFIYPVKVFMLCDYSDDIETMLQFKNSFDKDKIKFVDDDLTGDYVKNSRERIIDEVDYLLVVISERNMLNDSFMQILINEFESGKTEKIFPLIMDKAIYNPNKRVEIYKTWEERVKNLHKVKKEGIINVDIFETLLMYERISYKIGEFLHYAMLVDRNNNLNIEDKFAKRLNKDGRKDIYIKEPSSQGVIHLCEYRKSEGIGMTKENDTTTSKTELNKCNIHVYHANDKNQFNVAYGNAIIHGRQDNAAVTDEFNDIVSAIREDIKELKDGGAKELQDKLTEIENDYKRDISVGGKGKNWLVLLTQMLSIANGTPKLVENLIKLQEYLSKFLN